MARGRKPEPAAVKEAKGNPGRRRIATGVLEARELAAAAPPELAAAARQVWERLAPELARLKFLRETDRGAFARYCEYLAGWWIFTAALRTEGETYLAKSEHNPDGLLRINPKFLLRERLERHLVNLEDRFGLSPMARQQILQRLAGILPIAREQPDMLAGAAAQAPAAPPQAPAASPVGLLTRTQVH